MRKSKGSLVGKSSMGEGSREVRVFDGPKIPEPPEVKNGVGGYWVWEGEVVRKLEHWSHFSLALHP